MSNLNSLEVSKILNNYIYLRSLPLSTHVTQAVSVSLIS